jgi:hypothetical protein
MGGAVGRGSAAKTAVRYVSTGGAVLDASGRGSGGAVWCGVVGVVGGQRTARGARSQRSTAGREGVRCKGLGRESVSAVEERWPCSRVAAPVSAHPLIRNNVSSRGFIGPRAHKETGTPRPRLAARQPRPRPLPARPAVVQQRRRALLLPPPTRLQTPPIQAGASQRRSRGTPSTQSALIWLPRRWRAWRRLAKWASTSRSRRPALNSCGLR